MKSPAFDVPIRLIRTVCGPAPPTEPFSSCFESLALLTLVRRELGATAPTVSSLDCCSGVGPCLLSQSSNVPVAQIAFTSHRERSPHIEVPD